ncbi:MAG: hypothetical protein HYY25_10515 [Candidatus Wallbacteria bacterium]|nr:hypothetical protein [Candidatus Wallbacteria bacterium]
MTDFGATGLAATGFFVAGLEAGRSDGFLEFFATGLFDEGFAATFFEGFTAAAALAGRAATGRRPIGLPPAFTTLVAGRLAVLAAAGFFVGLATTLAAGFDARSAGAFLGAAFWAAGFAVAGFRAAGFFGEATVFGLALGRSGLAFLGGALVLPVVGAGRRFGNALAAAA